MTPKKKRTQERVFMRETEAVYMCMQSFQAVRSSDTAVAVTVLCSSVKKNTNKEKKTKKMKKKKWKRRRKKKKKKRRRRKRQQGKARWSQTCRTTVPA